MSTVFFFTGVIGDYLSVISDRMKCSRVAVLFHHLVIRGGLVTVYLTMWNVLQAILRSQLTYTVYYSTCFNTPKPNDWLIWIINTPMYTLTMWTYNHTSDCFQWWTVIWRVQLYVRWLGSDSSSFRKSGMFSWHNGQTPWAVNLIRR